jgi:hypothetical protein
LNEKLRTALFGVYNNKIKKELKGAYYNQTYRCNSPSCHAYKTYGAKGIKVEYSFSEFLKWCFKNGYRKGNVIGRIDHSKNYSLDNIQIEANKTIGTVERNKRLGNPAKHNRIKVCSIDMLSGQIIKIFDSLSDCAFFHKRKTETIRRHCTYKNVNLRNNITFRHYEKTHGGDSC